MGSYFSSPLLEYSKNKLKETKKYCLMALKIKDHTKSYINEIFSWDCTIDDLLSICYYYENDIENSLKHINRALKYSPLNKRLLDNKKIIESKINS